LASTDHARGHLAVLAVLTLVTDPGSAAWAAQFHAMRAAPHTYYPLVIVDQASDQIVATGCVFIERKFLRGLGSVGHIEDIAVNRAQQGKGLGLRVIQALTHISETSGCYKTILNCSEDNTRQSPVWAPAGRLLIRGAAQLFTGNAGMRRRSARWCVGVGAVLRVS
jgi:glucosamine-phosphate N-acetyltransferase